VVVDGRDQEKAAFAEYPTHIVLYHQAVVAVGGNASDATFPRTYEVVGEPRTIADAAQLAREAPFQFQAWSLRLVGARLSGSTKKGSDKGVDGRLYFHDEGPTGKTKQIIFSVEVRQSGAGICS
jgi:hypothetical protein